LRLCEELALLTLISLACIMKSPQVGWAIAVLLRPNRGKSALHRARRRGNLGMEQSIGSGHRNKQPHCPEKGSGVMVKRWCKRPPARAAMRARQATPAGSKVKQRWGAARSFFSLG